MYFAYMKIAVAISGGVDSLYALIYLKEQGHDVFALHARFIQSNYEIENALKKVCQQLNVPLHIIDLQNTFEENVIIPFFNTYKNAQTPNPCALCNKSMKFGKLLEEAQKLGAEKLATGHYVKLTNFINKITSNYGFCIQSADDLTKDQSYFLALTPINNLRSAIFPLADKIKEDIKQEIANRNIEIPVAKESQEICFVPDDDYRAYLLEHKEKYNFDSDKFGDVFYINSKTTPQQKKKIASHKGLWAYTEGQRKGIGIAWSEPLYVVKRNVEDNSLLVGSKEEITTKFAMANNINYLVPPHLWYGQLYARTRFREKQSPAKVYIQNAYEKLEILIDNPTSTKHIINNYHIINTPETKLLIEFNEEKQIYAPGQVLAIYDENNFLLAGGILY